MKKTSLFLVVTLAAVISLYAQNVPAGLRYEDEGSGVRITGYTGTAKNLDLPGRINGKIVTVIGSRAFSNNRTLESVMLPNGTTTIETEAFAGCIALQSVTMPDTVTTIERSAFGNCIALKTITWPANLTTIGQNAFRQCSSLSGSITFPASLRTIGDSAFGGTSLTSVTIPQGAQVGANAIPPNTAIVAPLSAAASLLVGTWGRSAGSYSETYVFNGDGTGVYTERSGNTVVDTDPFKWTVSGTTLTTTFTNNNSVDSNRYSINGDTLALGSTRYTRQAAAASPLVGTWSMTAGYNTETFVFNADGTGAYKRLNKDGSGKVLADVTDPFKWTASGNMVTIAIGDGKGSAPEPYSISGNTLTLSRIPYTRQ